MSVAFSDVTVEAGSTNLPVAVQNFPATQPVSIATMPTTPVTGTFWQATQPVSIAGTVATTVGMSSTAAITRIATSTTAVTLLAANVNRKKVIINTETGTSNYIAFGSTASATNYTYNIGSNAVIEDTTWTGSISCVRSSGTGSVQVTELS